jgi:acetyltransferase-like isoleucine patch superfamily enzyme
VNTRVPLTLAKTSYYRLLGKNINAHYGTRIVGLKNIEFAEGGKLSIGLTSIGFLNDSDHTYLNVRGRLRVAGRAYIHKGTRLDVSGICELGQVAIGGRCTIVVTDHLTIGDGTEVGWDCTLLDNDFHSLGDQPSGAAISIGKNVWIGMGVRLMKGVTIGDGSIIGAGSVVTKSIPERVFAAGVPARVLVENVDWTSRPT